MKDKPACQLGGLRGMGKKEKQDSRQRATGSFLDPSVFLFRCHVVISLLFLFSGKKHEWKRLSLISYLTLDSACNQLGIGEAGRTTFQL